MPREPHTPQPPASHLPATRARNHACNHVFPSRALHVQIISRCIAHVDIRSVFDGDVLAVMTCLNECINTCQEWRRCYTEVVAAVDANPGKRQLRWNFDYMSIFAQIEAFVQRCRDLLEVCEGQIQFARRSLPGGGKAPLPSFGGARGPDISRSLQTIEETFNTYLTLLRDISHEILDVKATRWHDVNNTFKNGMKELEVMMANVITDAFHGVTSVPVAVDLLEAFSSLAKRAAVQRAVDKKAVEVYSLFLKQVCARVFVSPHPPTLTHAHTPNTSRTPACSCGGTRAVPVCALALRYNNIRIAQRQRFVRFPSPRSCHAVVRCQGVLRGERRGACHPTR
ncbi:hypothetical protein EON62_00895 [archaeon]|nr:MAG: hypothetical protein EON62_00895 [archaeon]